MTADVASLECSSCGSLLCPTDYCCLFYPRRHPIDLQPAQTVDDPDWPGGRPIIEAMA